MRDRKDDMNHGYSSHSGFSHRTSDFAQYDRSRPVNTERESHYGNSSPLQSQRHSLEPGEIRLSSGSNRFGEPDRFGQRGEYGDDERYGYCDRVKKSSSDSRKFEYENSKDSFKYYDDYDRNRIINSKDDYDRNRTINTSANRNDFDVGGDGVVPSSSSSRQRVLEMGPTGRNYGGGGGSAPRNGCGSTGKYEAVDDGGSIAARSCCPRMMEMGPTSRSYRVTDGSGRGGLAARRSCSPEMIEMGPTVRNYGGSGSAARSPRTSRVIETGHPSRNYRVVDGSHGSFRDGKSVSRAMEPSGRIYVGGGSAARSPRSPLAIETGPASRNYRVVVGSHGSVWDGESMSRSMEPTGRNYGGGAARSPRSPRAIEMGLTSRNFRVIDGSCGSIRDGESVPRVIELGPSSRNYGDVDSVRDGESATQSRYRHRMMEMGLVDIGRKYGVTGDYGGCRSHGYDSSCSPLKEYGLRGRERTDIMDSIKRKIEGSSCNFPNVTSDKRILSENRDTSFCNESEKDLEYLSTDLVRKRTRSVEKSNYVEDANTFGNNYIVNERGLLLEKQDIPFAGNEYDLDHRILNLVKKRRTTVEDDSYDDDIPYRNGTTSERRSSSENDSSSFDMVKLRSSNILDSINREGNCNTDNEYAFGNNMMYKKRLDSSFVENDEDLDYRSFDSMKIKKSSTSIVDRIGSKIDVNDDITFGNEMISGRRRLVANDPSFGELDNDLDGRCSDSNLEILQYGELYGVSGVSHGDGLERKPFYHEDLYSTRSTSQRLVSPDETLEMRLTRNHSSDMVTSIGDQRTVLSSGSSDLDEITHLNYGDAYYAYEDIQQLSMLQNSRQRQYRFGNPEMFNEMEICGNAISENSLEAHLLLPGQSNLSQHVRPLKSNVKQRLGPIPSVKDRLGPIPNAGRGSRLGPNVTRKLPWVDVQRGKTKDGKQNKPEPKEVFSLNSSEVKTNKHIKSEPHEGSEEFSQLVQNAFLKFVKILNENSATQRKYLEQGGGSLKCYICGSSKEFADTLSLAHHSFMSCKVGSRSEHLGFGKALCVLMGWNSVIVPNGRWIQQILPAAEASSLREDLIIWPPVVLIHNSAIANDNRDERMIVSTGRLKEILEGLGFERWITKICRGKAANIMAVNFKGIFPGLCEAEKLHKIFGEKNHGRTEFELISRKDHKKNSQETEIQLDKVESVLYGYMGIAGDLDLLDFEIKKRCFVRSKKEILAIADANLESES